MEGGEIEDRDEKMPKKRKKSSAYGFAALLAFLLAITVYTSNPDNWLLAIMLLIFGLGIVVAGQ